MSKYVKLEEVIETVYQCRRAEANDEWIKRWLEPLNSLPTIEVSEDAISREWLCTVFGLSEKTRKWGGDHSGYNTMMLYEIQDYIEDAPSVVPKERIEE